MNDNLLITDPQPSRADALKNRALLLETAQRLFAEQGVENVSMTAIADAAEVGKGTLYRHFKSKSELCHALLDHETRDLQERSLRRLQNFGDPLDDLAWFLEQIARFVIQNTRLLCAASHQRPERREDGDSEREVPQVTLNHPAHFWWRVTIRGLLQRIQPPGDIDYMADVLYVMLDVHTIYFQRDTLGYDTQRIIDGLASTLYSFTR
jgi:AcrR family transcriptional regulator